MVNVIGLNNLRPAVFCSTPSKPVALNTTNYPERYQYFTNTTAYINAQPQVTGKAYVRYDYMTLFGDVYQANFGNTDMFYNNPNFVVYWNKVYNSTNVKCLLTE
jgi:hypothetical protein